MLGDLPSCVIIPAFYQSIKLEPRDSATSLGGGAAENRILSILNLWPFEWLGHGETVKLKHPSSDNLLTHEQKRRRLPILRFLRS